MKYVFVTGGVVSSLGKGITAGSLGRLLKDRGYRVSMQKCDPYYNVDPGLLSPLQHGEAFITEDGIAADLDLGHYERFIDENLRGEASVTTGKIHKTMMERELRGEYKGGTVQVIPHVTNEIKTRIKSAAMNSGAEIAIIEIGGTVGDMESSPFMEAIRQMKWELGERDVCFVHVTLLPYIAAAGELKTKPTQHSVQALRSIGIQPDVVVCRSEVDISVEAKGKIALFCNVKSSHVIQNSDAETLYDVPLMLEREGFADVVCKVLDLPKREADSSEWRRIAEQFKNPARKLNIALVGKYVVLHDAYLSVVEALTHAGIDHRASVKITWIQSDMLTDDNAAEKLSGFDGIIIPGGYGQSGAEGIITACRYAREHRRPCLMIGYGMQLGVVEAVRSLLGEKQANSTEVDEHANPAVVKIPADRPADSRQSRMGAHPIHLTEGRIQEIYGSCDISERHGNRYEIATEFAAPLAEHGFLFTGTSPDGKYLEAFEVTDHPFYIGVIAHPEFKSRPNRAHPLFSAFIQASMK